MDQHGEIIIYQTEDGLTRISVNLYEETVWLTPDQMAELFQRDKSTISRHIKNIFTEGELVREATVAKFATVQPEGDRQVERLIDYYNLDVIISVGYRVKSLRGTQFRIRAASVLKEYMIKGFALDDERLKGNGGGKQLISRLSQILTAEFGEGFSARALRDDRKSCLCFPDSDIWHACVPNLTWTQFRLPCIL